MKTISTFILFTILCACVHAHPGHKHRFTDDKKKQHKSDKTYGFIDIQLKEMSRDKHSLVLQATVIPHRNMVGSQTEWKVPQGVRVSDGALDGNVDLKTNEPIKYSLSIDIDTLKKGEKIFFFAYQMNNGERYGTSAMFVYNDETEESVSQKSKKKFTIDKKRIFH